MENEEVADAARIMAQLGASKGGVARANALSAERRREIGRQAVAARWAKQGKSDDLPRATHAGELKIADSELACYVLGESGERIFSTRGIMRSLGRSWRGRKYAGTELPVFLEANNLKPYIPNDSGLVLIPKKFRTDKGMVSEGFNAEILPVICETYLRADDEGKLTMAQKPIAAKCRLLVRALSRVGVIALVDEATGYQEVRDRMALQKILERYISKELVAWAKRFPDEFYEEMFRLKGWQWKGMSVPKPSYVGKLTLDLVYARLAPGVMDELKRITPRNEKGKLVHKMHQHLTEEIGHPALTRHMHAITAFMRASQDWETFYRMLGRAFPKLGETPDMLPEGLS